MKWETEEQWSRAYDDAMQWRDWMTCEIMLDERERADWWRREKRRKALRKLLKERYERIGW